MSRSGSAVSKLPPEVNRVVYVRNLPFKISAEELYDLFGKYGPLRQVRLGTAPDTRGTALVVYEDIFDAKACVEHLSGFNVAGRYLVCLYYQPTRVAARSKIDAEKKRAELAQLRDRIAAAAAAGTKQQQSHPTSKAVPADMPDQFSRAP